VDGSSSLGAAQLSGGTASISTSQLGVGSHSITVTYGGDSNFLASLPSASATQIVAAASTSVSLSSSSNIIISGRPITFTATVTVLAPGAGNPAGSVNFLDSGTVIGSAPLVGNTATLQTTFSAGTHSISAAYVSADGNFSGSAAVTPSVVTAGTLNQAFVDKVYIDLLHRHADPGGLAGWTAALDRGTNRNTIVRGIENSFEYRQIEVNNLYQEFLHRNADAGGLAGWVNFLNTGTVEQVGSMLVASPEYLNAARVHNDNNAWLAALGQDAMGHAFSNQEQSVLLLLLQNFTPRDKVALLALRSSEAESALIGSYYQRFLHRAADQNGLNGWVSNVVNGGQRQEDVIAGIVSSDEYFSQI
jgi:hypothetical protein